MAYVYSDILNDYLDALVSNTSTDAPIDSATGARALNSAYADLYDLEARGFTSATSATAWGAGTITTGTTGALTNIRRVLRIWSSKVSTSTGASDLDRAMKIVPLDRIQYLRDGAMTSQPTQEYPLECALTPVGTTTPANVGKLRIDFWPISTSHYFPIEYRQNFTPIDSVTVTTPDLSDIGARLLPLLAARRTAQQLGRGDLVPAIQKQLEERVVSDDGRKYRALVAMR